MADTADTLGRAALTPVPAMGAGRPTAAPHPPVRRRRRIRLATLFAVVFGGLTAVALALVLTLVVIANARNTLTLLNEKAVLLTSLLRSDVVAALKPLEETVATFQTIYADSDAVTIDRPDHALVSGVLAGAPSVKAFLLHDLSFVPKGMIRDDSGKFVPWDPGDTEADAVIESLRPLEPGDPPTWGTPVVVAGASYLYVAAPLARDGRLEGYVIAAIASETVFDAFKAIETHYGAIPFLLYGGDRLLLPAEMIGANCDETCEAMRSLEGVGDPVLRYFENRIEADSFRLARRDGVSVGVIAPPDSDSEFIVVTQDLDALNGLPLTLGAYLDEEAAGSEIQRLIGSAAVSGAIAIVAIILSVLIGRRLARAIGRASEEAQHVAALHFDKIGRLPRSRIREIDIEAQAFNAMAEALQTFARYVPGDFVRRLIREGYHEAAKSEVRPAAIMFTDIVGFTRQSEALGAEASAALLNHHFGKIVEGVRGTGGIVDKFMGDGSMAFWTLPDGVGHEKAAVLAACRIGRKIMLRAARARARGDTPIRIRIGIHAGDVIVGNVGPPDRVNYTVVGDSVNVAARLEQLGREVAPGDDCVILVSDGVAAALDDTVRREKTGAFHLRNRAQQIDVWRILLEA